MEVTAYAKYLRISPKKVRELAASVVGLPAKQATDRLTLMNTKASRLLLEVIKSALGNATNNLKLNSTSLRVKTVQVGKGPFFKRYQPVARGMAHQIKKRTSHLKVILEDVPNQSVSTVSVKSKKLEKVIERSKNGA